MMGEATEPYAREIQYLRATIKHLNATRDKEITRLNAVLDRMVGRCLVSPYSSCICERGTKGCDTDHTVYVRNRGATPPEEI